MKSTNEVEILKHNVKELQSQLHSAQVRIAALNSKLVEYRTKYRDLVDNNEYKEKYRNAIDQQLDYKMTQKSLTELNYDGNETRGRYGEDESL